MPTGFARASIDDHILSRERGPAPLGRTPSKAGVGLVRAQEFNTGPSNGRLVSHPRT